LASARTLRPIKDSTRAAVNPAPSRRRHSGLLLLPLALSAYFIAGRVNVFPYRGYVDNSVLLLLAIALVGYCMGVSLAALCWRVKEHASEGQFTPPGYKRLAIVNGWIGLASVVLTVGAFGGIPLLVGGDERLQVSPRLTALAIGGVIALAILGSFSAATRWTIGRGILLLAGCGVLFVLGYRTLPLLVIFTIMVFSWIRGQLRLNPKSLVTALLVLVGFSWAAVPRFGHEGAGGYFAPLYALGMPRWFEPLAPMWLVPREGVAVLGELYHSIPLISPFAHGSVFLSSFNVLQVGNLSARELVAAAIGGRPGITITPSLLGEPYMDFGMVGVLFAMMVIGFVLASLYYWHTRAHTWAPAVAYAFLNGLLLLDVHSGLLDPAPIAGLGILVLYARYAETRSRVLQVVATGTTEQREL
jgi:hypothetical protein